MTLLTLPVVPTLPPVSRVYSAHSDWSSSRLRDQETAARHAGRLSTSQQIDNTWRTPGNEGRAPLAEQDDLLEECANPFDKVLGELTVT